MILGFFLALSLFSPFSQASRCPEVSSSNQLVVTFEGLGGETMGAPVLKMIEQINQSGFQIANFTHEHTITTIAACVRRWALHTPQSKVSIVGHGLGGATSHELARVLAEQGISTNILILFDTRNGSEGKTGRLPAFAKPQSVKYVFNFFQRGPLGGHTYAKGPGVFNFELSSNHVSLPLDPQALSINKGVLNEGITQFTPQRLNSVANQFPYSPALSELGLAFQNESKGRLKVSSAEPQIGSPDQSPSKTYQRIQNASGCDQLGPSFDCGASQYFDSSPSSRY